MEHTMRLLLLALFVWYVLPMEGAFAYRKSVTVNSGQVSSGPHADFAMLVSETDADLAAGAGKVQDAQGDDIQFFSNSDCTTGKLDWERELYNSSTGQIIFWVRVSSIDVGSVIYRCYGDATETADESNPAGVWDSATLVRHGFGDGSTITTTDSTSNNNDFSSVGSFAANSGGKVYGAAAQGGTSYINMNGSPLDALTNFTIDMWIYNTRDANDVAFFSDWDSQQTLWRYSFTSSYRLIINWSDATSTDFDPYVATGDADDTWTKMSVTYDGTTVRVYTNGAQVTTAAASGKTVKSHTSTNTQNLGGGATGTEGYWRGRLDEMRIANTYRSAGWLATEYNNVNAPGSFYATGSEVSLGSAAIAGSVIVIQ